MSEGWNRSRSSRWDTEHATIVAALSLVLFLASGFFVATNASAELRRVEAVGIYGIRDSARAHVIPRDEAIARARWEGISRVALELIGESEDIPGSDGEPLSTGEEGGNLSGGGASTADNSIPPLERPGGENERSLEAGMDPWVDAHDVRFDRVAPSANETALLRLALGKDMLPYTRSYRILEDQGELPVLFNDVPGVETEYVVVVEVIVDLDRIAAALESAGLVAAAAVQGAGTALTLELVGLARYEALEVALAALRGPLGATRVQTVEFERERQLISIEGPYGAEGLAERISRFRDPRLTLEPIALDPVFGRLRVLGRWSPASGEALDGESGTADGPAS